MRISGELLKARREKALLSQAALAQKSGVAAKTISRLEHDERTPQLSTILALAGALECKPSDICAGLERAAPDRSAFPRFTAEELHELEEIARFAAFAGAGAAMPFFRSALASPAPRGRGNVATRGDVNSTIQMTRALIPMLESFTQRRHRRYSIYAEELSREASISAEIDDWLSTGELRAASIARDSETFSSCLKTDVGVLFDGLDGTSNFRAGLPIFCIAIAIFDGAIPAVAAVYDPIHNVLYSASLGTGGAAHLWDVCSGVRLDLQTLRKPGDDIQVLGTHLPSDPDGRTLSLRMLNRFAAAKRPDKSGARLFDRVTMLNSGELALAYVASRSLAGFVNASTSIWDVAAGEVLVRSLGGLVTDLEGEPIGYAGGRDRTPVLAAWSQETHDTLLSLCTEASVVAADRSRR